MMRSVSLVALMTAALLAPPSVQGAVTTIDDFSTPTTFPVVLTSGGATTDNPATNTVSGERTVTMVSGSVGAAALVGTSGGVMNLGLTNGSGVFDVSYGGGGLFNSLAAGSFDLSLVGTDPSGSGTTVQIFVNGGSVAGPQALVGGVNTIPVAALGTVDSLAFRFDIPDDGDIMIALISHREPDPEPTIPEPMSVAVWSILGIVGLAVRRRG